MIGDPPRDGVYPYLGGQNDQPLGAGWPSLGRWVTIAGRLHLVLSPGAPTPDGSGWWVTMIIPCMDRWPPWEWWLTTHWWPYCMVGNHPWDGGFWMPPYRSFIMVLILRIKSRYPISMFIVHYLLVYFRWWVINGHWPSWVGWRTLPGNYVKSNFSSTNTGLSYWNWAWQSFNFP